MLQSTIAEQDRAAGLIPGPAVQLPNVTRFSIGAPARGTNGLAAAEVVAAAALPMLATTSLYLPGGILSPWRAAVMVLAGLAVVRVVREPGLLRSPVLGAVTLVAAIFGLFGVLGLVRNPGMTHPSELGHVGFIALATTSLAVLGRRAHVVVALVGGWLAAGLVSAVVGLWETFTHRHLPRNLPGAAYGHRADGWKIVSAFFDNPNLYAYMLAVLIPLCLMAFLATRRWWLRGTATGLALLFVQQMYMTDGRAAMLTVFLTVVLLMLRSWPGRALLVAGLLGFRLAVGLGILPAVTLWVAIHEAYAQAHEAPRSTWLRVQLVKSGWHMLRESDWLGVGPGGYPVRNMLPSNPVNIWWMPNPHWGMVEVMAEYGVVTTAVLALALAVGAGTCLWLSLRHRRRDVAAGRSAFASRWTHPRSTLALTAIMLVSVPVVSLANSTWLRQPLTAVHLATLVALLAWAVSSLRSPSRPSPSPAEAG